MKYLPLVLFFILGALQSASTQTRRNPVEYKDLKNTDSITFEKTDGKYRLLITKLDGGSAPRLNQDSENSLPVAVVVKNGNASYDLNKSVKDGVLKFMLTLVSGGKKIPVKISENSVIGDMPGTNQNKDSAVVATGIAWQDAVLLTELMRADCGNWNAMKWIINKYTQSPYLDLNGINSGTNPYLKRALALCRQNNPADRIPKLDLNAFHTNTGQLLGGSLGGIDVTSYVQAFADFLRERVKAELTISFINKLRDSIGKSPELKALLPNTYQVFQTSDPFSTPTMGATYKAAFLEDIAGLPENFESMVYNLQKYNMFKQKEEFWMFVIAYHMTKMSGQGYHPADVVHQLNGTYGFDEQNRKLDANYILSVLDMFSQNLRTVPVISKDDGSTLNKAVKWISKDDLKLANEQVMNLFLGLLYEKYRVLFDHQIKNGSLSTSLQQQLLTFTDQSDKILGFLTIANNIDSRINEYKKQVANDTVLSAEDKKKKALGFFLSQADGLIEVISYTARLTGILNSWPDSSINKRLAVVKQSVTVAKAINSENIGLAATSSIRLIQLVSGGDTLKLATLQKLTYYTNFITDLAAADSASKIRDVLNQYAAPVQSYRTIRLSKTSVALSSYPGLIAGYEFPYKDTSTGLTYKGRGNFGITAPLGISISRGGLGNKHSSSTALYLQLIDIAAAFKYRWDNQEGDLPQKIYLKQIFSPGLAGVYGFKNSPLALKAGVQYNPLLRSISDGTKDYGVNVFSASLGLCLEIPVFIFSRKDR